MSKVKYIPAQEAREESPARWELDGYAIERDGDEVCSIGKKTGRGDWISMDAARAYHAILGAILGDQPAASDDKGCEVCACRDEDCANPKHAHHPTHQPAASETPAVKFKVGDKVRVREFHDRTGEVVGDLRDRYYRVRWDATNDIGLASPGYIEAAPPASPARSERPTPIYDPIAIKIVDHMNKCGYFDDDAENIAGAYSEVHHLMRVCANATPAPRDEAKYAKDLADEYVMGVATVGCREDGIARNAYVAGWLACARARDGGR